MPNFSRNFSNLFWLTCGKSLPCELAGPSRIGVVAPRVRNCQNDFDRHYGTPRDPPRGQGGYPLLRQAGGGERSIFSVDVMFRRHTLRQPSASMAWSFATRRRKFSSVENSAARKAPIRSAASHGPTICAPMHMMLTSSCSTD